jgi:hypothetical protein
VHSAGIQDRDGAKEVLKTLVTRFPGLELIWADGGYAGKLVTWVATVLQRALVIVKRLSTPKDFRSCNGAGSLNARLAGSIVRGG